MKKLFRFVFSTLKAFILPGWMKSLIEIISEISCSFRTIPAPEEKPAEPESVSPLMDFVSRYEGRNIDFDGFFGYTCVDLVRQYFQEVWKIPQPEPTGDAGAAAFYVKHGSRPIQARHLDLITYNPRMVPPDGAVIVFRGTETNRFGHIGICVNADERGINLFEQDGFRQSPAAIRRWDYGRVLGWLAVRR